MVLIHIRTKVKVGTVKHVSALWYFYLSLFVAPFCHLCFVFVFVILSFLFLAALWSPAGKGLTFWLLCVVCISCVFVIFPYDVQGQVWYLILSISDLYFLPYLKTYITCQ